MEANPLARGENIVFRDHGRACSVSGKAIRPLLRSPLPSFALTIRERRFDVVSAEQLEKLAVQPLPFGEASSARVLYRDLYVDTDDDQLQRRGIACRLRVGSDGRRTLTVFVGTLNDPTPAKRYEADVDAADPRAALTSRTEPARRLAAVVDFRLLQTKLELQLERVERRADKDLLRRPRLYLLYDRVHVRSSWGS